MLRRLIVFGTLMAAAATAQLTSFPKPGYFRETFARSQTRVVLNAPVRIQDFVVDGKIELSLRHFLELVMANNTDVQVQFVSLEIPRYGILNAFGAWDPRASASFSTTRSTGLPSSALDAVSAAAITKSLTQPYSLAYSQTLDTGTSYSVQFSGSKTSETNSFLSYNPSITAGLQFAVSQPLIRNRSRYVNRLPLMMAQSNFRVSDYAMRNQILGLVNNAEMAYWNVISARETLNVDIQARDTTAAYLKFMQQQLDLGALSPLDIFNPKANLAAAEVTVSQAKYALVQAEDALRHQIGVDLDPQLRKLPLVLTEPADPGPTESMVFDREEEVRKALALNPAEKGAVEKMAYDDLGIQSAHNGLLPNLMLSAAYTAQGRGGIFYPGSSSILSDGTVAPPVPGGLSNALSQMFGFGYPTYQAGLSLTLPIRSRSASAAMGTALVQKKLDALAERNQQQNIRLQILTDVTAVEGAKEQLKLSIVERDYAKLNLDAENQKYQLGTETNQNVILAQQTLASAELNVVNYQIALRKSILNLLTQTGELLDARSIVIP